MRRRLIFAIVGACAGLACSGVRAETTPAAPIDPMAKLSLLAAAFDGNDTAPEPEPERATAMAFLPGRGVVRWDVTGKTPEQAREAQIEAMGAADARAVQREIDLAAEETAMLDARDAERAALNRGSGGGRLVLAMPSWRSFSRQTGAAPANRGAGGRTGFGVRSGESLRGRPRMYAFAAVSGRSVGFNVMHDDAGWRNGGVTTDRDGFTGQRQAGLAWRKGPVQASLSYVQQKDHTQILGAQTDKDHRVMLTMNVQPQAIAGLFGKTP